MHKLIEKINQMKVSQKFLKNIFSKLEIKNLLIYMKLLPITVHNKKQNVIKKRWLFDYNKELEKLFYKKLKNEIGDFKYDNFKSDDGKDILGLFQESYNPIGLHIDGGFNLNDQIYKQSLIPLTPLEAQLYLKIDFTVNLQTSQQRKKN